MIARILLVVLLIVGLSGCAINLNSLQSDMPNKHLTKLLARDCDLKLPGMYQDVYISALVIHKSLKDYVLNIPEDKTRIDFELRGKQENINIEKTMFIITTENGFNYKISGLGGETPIVNGAKSDIIGFTVNSCKGGPNNNLLNEFSLLMPFKLANDIGTLRIDINTTSSENTCKMKWVFSD